LEYLTSEAAKGDGVVVDPDGYNRQKHAAHRTLTWSSWALLGTMGLGILDAHLRFESERKLGTRKRDLPPELELPPEPAEPEDETDLSISPVFGFGPGGAHVGVVGTF
jgi:hypothetical protein